jgi:hypothetical protein
MQEIDFLPNSYRERRLRVRLWAWRFAVLAGFGVIICTIAALQFAQYQRARQRLAQMSKLRTQAEEKNASLASLQAELDAAQEFAELYTYLAHPWPRTQILSALAKPLPPSMCLSEVSIARTSMSPSQQVLQNRPLLASQQTNPKQRPARADLDRCRNACDAMVSVVHLAGETSEPTDVHGYVATLGASPLFASAELESLELVPTNEAVSKSAFHIRLKVRHGYGQPNGPSEPPPALAATHHLDREGALP